MLRSLKKPRNGTRSASKFSDRKQQSLRPETTVSETGKDSRSVRKRQTDVDEKAGLVV